ncbi:UDP-N-acetylmuramoyl-L-alanine--D-glutamate ligase [Candidatus Beckwithbacteria bacterium CG10_big_fil_rev_8_21_14_0_10_34_10]|uniref:UDP-N-acetylmuramoylalanine--D-glutamate ligase n=1 Tax=Candidatus Beckwithbacteria bacterium CG10_big_fil_rev_8_21_14_0_10_34_10 TaxID=1974495 RepID=A0A2H0W8Z7_9BACT|nr:MAG: UDP-N-acetylmuramoyl-L-alanine--D-glutamate ligase [Candidatus Beckwithbacteria bacterium CG10_big_fil_rev_8_21_14_0_10_34_10]
MNKKKPWLVKFNKDLKGKKVLILGLGVLGRGVRDAEFLANLGAKVTVTDLKKAYKLKPSLDKLKGLKIKFVLGEHRKKDVLEADLVLRNPAVPLNSPLLKLAAQRNIPILMDESLFLKYAPVKVIGVTGTRGKSTVTNLAFNLLKEAQFKVHLSGNIRNKASLPLLEKVEKGDFVVMELSSWQLQGLGREKKSPHISIFTNIYEDHLNRYSSMKDYFNDKKAIFKYQTKDDFLILNSGSEKVRNLAEETKSKVIFYNKKAFPKDWQIKLKGDHNLENASAVIKLGEVLGIKKEIVKKVILTFSGLEHRLEKVRELKGVEYYNDSTSTTPVAGMAALNSFKKEIILIAGGSRKNLEMTEFGKLIAQKVRRVIFLTGEETNNLVNLVKKYGGEEKIEGVFDNFKKAVLKAQAVAKKNEIVLLSPGCASFGMFQNEFDRGDQFKKIVLELK